MKTIEVEKLAEAILKVAEGFEALSKTNLNQKAIIALLKGMPGMSEINKSIIKLILNNISNLKKWYIIEDKKK